MAIRYSGDVEMRLKWTGWKYTVSVRWPHGRWDGIVQATDILHSETTSPVYDRIAERVAKTLLKQYGKRVPFVLDHRGRPQISRMFQAPCPT